MTRTRRLYHEDPELRTFEATVLSVVAAPGGRADVVLDRTAFYPTGGGQPHDLGRLAGLDLEDVFEAGEAVVHRLPGPPPDARVLGEVDWRRRSDHRQQHSGQHLLSRALLDGCGARTVGFHLGEAVSTIDLDREPSEAELESAERLANSVVLADHPVEVRWIDSAAEAPPGLRKEVPVEGPLRIVGLGPFDATFCSGTHCGRTGQVGPIRILRWERRRGGLRVEFVCGTRALEDGTHRRRVLRAAARHFSTEDSLVADRVLALLTEQKTLRGRVDALEAEARERLVETWSTEASPGPFFRVLEEAQIPWLEPLARALAERRREPVLLAGSKPPETRVVLALPPGSPKHAGEVLRPLLTSLGGRGGGSERTAQGVLPGTRLEALIEQWRRGVNVS